MNTSDSNGVTKDFHPRSAKYPFRNYDGSQQDLSSSKSPGRALTVGFSISDGQMPRANWRQKRAAFGLVGRRLRLGQFDCRKSESRLNLRPWTIQPSRLRRLRAAAPALPKPDRALEKLLAI